MNNSSSGPGFLPSNDEGRPTPLLLLPVLLSTLWILFQLFYAPRLLAFFTNRLVNLFLKDSGIYISSLRINLLTGRVLFKNVHFYCRDYSIRVTDGYVTLRWFVQCGRDVCSKCAASSKGSVERRSAFLFFQLNGFEYHWYNRSDVYDEWGIVKTEEGAENSDTEESGFWRWWKSSQPSLHFSINKGRIMLGNHLVERSLVVYFKKVEAHYSTTEASNPYDELMNVLDWNGDTVRVVLEPSHGYTGKVSTERPPTLYEGTDDVYLVMRSDNAQITYSLDSPGLVPLGDTQPPKFSFDVVLGDNTVINYGCYGNRQRILLQHFFFPSDYVAKGITVYPEPGEKRIYTMFDVKVQLSTPATVNVMFRDKETSLHQLTFGLGTGSNVAIHQPWTNDHEGNTSVVEGELNMVKANSSLSYPTLASADLVTFHVDLHFPRIWNATQNWDMKFTGDNVQVNILFNYVDFVNDLLDDWLGNDPSDLLTFVPLEWNIGIELTDYEIYLFTNRYNWVDVASKGVENTRLAFCGTTGQITFGLPFTEFIPAEQKIHFTAIGQDIVVRQYVPPSSSTREGMFALSRDNQYRWRTLPPLETPSEKLSSSISRSTRSKLTASKASSLTGSERTLDRDPPAPMEPSPLIKEHSKLSPPKPVHHVISAPVMVGGTPVAGGALRPISLEAIVEPSKEEEEEEEEEEVPDTEPLEMEEQNREEEHLGERDTEAFPMGFRGTTLYEEGWLDIGCGPSLSISIDYSSHIHDTRPGLCTPMMPNVLTVDVDAPTVLLRVFGCLARDLLALKENYPGEYIKVSTFNSNIPSQPLPQRPPPPHLVDAPPSSPFEGSDEPKERTLNVYVEFKLRNITAEFPTHLPEGYPRDFPLPSACTEVFRVNVEYLDRETKVWLHVDPLTVHVPSIVDPTQSGGQDSTQKSGGGTKYELGHVLVGGVAFNCHGFTEYLCQERVEYAWMMQLKIGRIAGSIATRQLLDALDWFYTAFIHTASTGDGFREAPDAEIIEPKVEPTSEKIKYLLFDLDIQEADVYITEGSNITRLQSHGFDLGLCTLHSFAETLGLSLQLQGLTATNYAPLTSDPALILEAGALDIGNIQGDLKLREILECVPGRQMTFLKKADERTRRLWFLWREDSNMALCGCCGGCPFLDHPIERRPARGKLESAVYCPQFPSLSNEGGGGTVSRFLGLQPLKHALMTCAIKETNCMNAIHHGLLKHYDLRYSKALETTDSPPLIQTSSNEPQKMSDPARISIYSQTSDGSFVSARSSLTSLTDEEFMSIENVNEAGLSGMSVSGGQTRHRKKPSALSIDFRAPPSTASNNNNSDTTDGEDMYDPLAYTQEYKEVLPSQTIRSVVLNIPLKKRLETTDDNDKNTLQPSHAPLTKQRSAPEPKSYLRQRSRDHAQSLHLPVHPTPDVAPHSDKPMESFFNLCVPLVNPLSAGFIPSVVRKGSSRPRERRRHGLHEPPQEDKEKLATVSLCVVVSGNITMTVSPPLLDFVENVTSSINDFFSHRSATSILSVLAHDSRTAVGDYLAKLLKEKSFQELPTPKHPLLHLTVTMAPGTFAAVQLLQVPRKLPSASSNQMENPTSTRPSTYLKQIAPHSSLLTIYTEGINCDVLLHTASVIQLSSQNKNSTSEEDSKQDENQKQGRTKLDSFKISADLKFPVIQLALCALVQGSSKSKSKHTTLPGLSQAQTQLNFHLQPSQSIDANNSSDGGGGGGVVCNLLEAGVREATATCVAEIIHSELSEEMILSWNNVQGHHLSDQLLRPKSEDCEKKNNQLVIKVSLPLFWSQIAAPYTGLANPSTGGLDVLVLIEAIEAWQVGVEHLITTVKGVVDAKTLRDRKVLLALISNAARMPVHTKPLNPVHSEVSVHLRQSVIYSCIHQLWTSLHSFSEDQLAFISLPKNEPPASICEEELIAALLALATRLYFLKELATVKKKRLAHQAIISDPVQATTCSSCGPLSPQSVQPPSDDESEFTTGYISISPSPSELAVPNMIYSSTQNLLGDIDFGPMFMKVQYSGLIVVREALLPLCLAAGLPVTPQLRTLCHNSAEYFADFTIELREATLFATEHMQMPTAPIQVTVFSSSPALMLEQVVVNGCLKYNSETSLGTSQQLALLKPVEQTGGMEVKNSDDFKSNISCKFCVSMDAVSTTVTIPLLKFSRHLADTAKLRKQWRRRLRIAAEDNMVTPKPPPPDIQVTVPTLVIGEMNEADSRESLRAAEQMGVMQFARSVIIHLNALERDTLLPQDVTDDNGDHVAGNTTPPSVASSGINVRILEYSKSPQTSKAHLLSPPSGSNNKDKNRLTVPHPTYQQAQLDTSLLGIKTEYHKRRLSTTSYTSSDEVAITMDELDDTPPDPISPASALEGDTTDSQHIVSSDAEAVLGRSTVVGGSRTPKQSVTIQASPRVSTVEDHSPTRVLSLSEGELLYSVFGLLKVNRISFEVQLQTTKGSFEIGGISAAVDARKAISTLIPVKYSTDELDFPIIGDILPSYLSVAATLEKSLLRISDKGLPESNLLLFSTQPIYGSMGVLNSSVPRQLPTYRCLLKCRGIKLDVKQSPVIVHKRFQQLMPAFTDIYNDVFASNSGTAATTTTTATPTTPTPNVVSIAEMKIPARLPRGLVHISLDKVVLLMAPLPSLSVTYTLDPVCAQMEMAKVINFQLEVGKHVLRFNPKEQYKGELSLRSLTLPTVCLKGEVKRSPRTKLPLMSLDLSIKQVNIDITTDVLNQLLIVQNSFIKELNDLLQMLFTIGESLPHREKLAPMRQTSMKDNGVELLSFLDSCKFSLSGIVLTVSTPLGTAIRFSTGKIDMTTTNTSTHPPGTEQLQATFAKSQFSLAGKVEIDISLALGYLQDNGPDVIDEICELAYFRTKISIRNTVQNVSQSSFPGALETDRDEVDGTIGVDTFLISILSPHLYIQSSAVEQAILFWLNCKSVYSFWQNERKQLNAEVQAATAAFIEKFNRPQPLQTSSIDFSQPRLVQINVSDVGACMPVLFMPATAQNTHSKAFPALVVTIKEMQLVLNLSHKVASTGKFKTFCMRFSEQFYLRSKTWTLDPKRHKFNNYGTINHGTFRLCIASRKRFSPIHPHIAVGEKLLFSFQWDMSGIEVIANTDIGKHISTLVRTMTTIGSDLEGKSKLTKTKSNANLASPKLQAPRQMRKTLSTTKTTYHHSHRRSHSVVHRSKSTYQAEDSYKIALEQEFAKQTRKVQKLKNSGASGESLKTEEELLRKLEQELALSVHRMFRHPRSSGISFQQLNQIFSPRAMSTKEMGGSASGGPSQKKLYTAVSAVKKKLFSHEEPVAEAEERPSSAIGSASQSPVGIRRRTKSAVDGMKPGHRRHKSDVTGMLLKAGYSPSASPSPTSTPPLDDDGAFEREHVPRDDSMTPVLSGPMISDQPSESEEGGFTLPNIDIEVNVTINVDYGAIRLTTESSTITKKFSFPSMAPSPHMRLKMNPSEPYSGPPSSVESVLLIPALTVKAHYQSIVGTSYSNTKAPSPSPRNTSPIPQTVSAPARIMETPQSLLTVEMDPSPPSDEAHVQAPPVKRGVLSLTAVVASLPEDIKLTPSLLEFIEHVARPTLAATVITSSSSAESDSTDVESDVEGETQQPPPTETWPISFPVDVTLAFQIQPSTVVLTCQPHSRVECVIRSPDVNFVISFSLFTHQQMETSPPGGLSSDNTSYVSGQTTIVPFNNLYLTGCLTTFVLELYSPQVSTLKQPGITAVEKKEALSLTLGQAFIHFSRKSVVAQSSSRRQEARSVDDYSNNTTNKLHVSVIMHIASLVLGYDMRRLNDITAFRRYWYRTSLVEALFIGTKKKPEDESSGSSTADILSPETTSGEESCEPSNIVNLDDTISGTIVVAASIEDFRIAANFAQVMGNANLLVTHLKFQAHADISHNELVLLRVDSKLVKGEVDARGGVIAGSILMEDTQVHVMTQSQQKSIPLHRGNVSIRLIEGKVDYMSSCIILARASQMMVTLCDSWEGLHFTDDVDGAPSLANIEIVADFKWEEFQIAINRSTTKNMFNIVQKMYDFVMQQKRRTERTMSLMLPAGSAASKALHAYREEQKRIAEKEKVAGKEDNRHHWLWAMKVSSVELMRTLGIVTPRDGHHDVSLGGKIFISGRNICIVCFHGPSFRDTEWAVFNIDLINANFSTQAIPGLAMKPVSDERTPNRTCQQRVRLCLGEDGKSQRQELGTIYRVQAARSGVPSVNGTSIKNWLAYACIDYHLHADKYTSDNSTLVRLSKKLTIHPILLVPAFSVELINDHFWPLHSEEGLLPRVECSLLSTFSEPGISVTTNVDHYLFLHDLIKAYIDYLERHKTPGVFGDPPTSASPTARVSPEPDAPSPTPLPGRVFECVWWQLDPRLLLLTTVSGQFNPHISWLLERLGFKQARTTIPKWIQRGAMDPLDLVISIAVESLIKLTGSKKIRYRVIQPPPPTVTVEAENLESDT